MHYDVMFIAVQNLGHRVRSFQFRSLSLSQKRKFNIFSNVVYVSYGFSLRQQNPLAPICGLAFALLKLHPDCEEYTYFQR